AVVAPLVLQRYAVPQRVSRDVERISVRAKLVAQHVARVTRIRPDLEKRRHRADKLMMVADQCSAPKVLLVIHAHCAIRLAERSEIMKLDLGALDRKRLRF